jgi:hypothetical protein
MVQTTRLSQQIKKLSLSQPNIDKLPIARARRVLIRRRLAKSVKAVVTVLIDSDILIYITAKEVGCNRWLIRTTIDQTI